MLETIKKHWKKEYVLIAVALLCVVLYFYGQKLNQNKSTQEVINALPIIGGLAFGFNTLMQLTK